MDDCRIPAQRNQPPSPTVIASPQGVAIRTPLRRIVPPGPTGAGEMRIATGQAALAMPW